MSPARSSIPLVARFLVLASSTLAACSAASPAGNGTTTAEAGKDDADDSDLGDGAAPSAKDAGNKSSRDAGQGGDPDPWSDDAGPDTTDASNVHDASVADAGVCNTVTRGKVVPTAVNGFADLKGGTLVDGYYLPTAYKQYISGTSNTTFPPISLGLHIQGGAVEFSTSYAGGEAFDYTFTTSAAEMVLVRTCGAPGKEHWYYDAKADTVVLYGFPGSNSAWYVTFERQP